jgi:hypothetical protein
MSQPTRPFALASVMITIAAIGTSARAGENDIPTATNDIPVEVIADQNGSCRGLISSPLGVIRGIVHAEPGGRKGWATFSSLHGLALAEIADLQGAGPHQGRLTGVLPVSGAFQPGSLRAGIITGPVGFAIDIGTSEAKVQMQDIHFTRSSLPDSAPALWFQDGDELFLYAFDGSSFRLLDRKTIPPGTSAVTLENVLISGYWIGAEPGSTACIAGSGGG